MQRASHEHPLRGGRHRPAQGAPVQRPQSHTDCKFLGEQGSFAPQAVRGTERPQLCSPSPLGLAEGYSPRLAGPVTQVSSGEAALAGGEPEPVEAPLSSPDGRWLQQKGLPTSPVSVLARVPLSALVQTRPSDAVCLGGCASSPVSGTSFEMPFPWPPSSPPPGPSQNPQSLISTLTKALQYPREAAWGVRSWCSGWSNSFMHSFITTSFKNEVRWVETRPTLGSHSCGCSRAWSGRLWWVRIPRRAASLAQVHFIVWVRTPGSGQALPRIHWFIYSIHSFNDSFIHSCLQQI